jgi:glycine cleavage system H protein
LPEVGTLIEQETPFGVVESVKTVSDLYAPVSGTVKAVNQDLESNPEQVNKEPYGGGWIIEIEISDKNELEKLMSPEKYSEQCDKEQG